MVCAWSKTEKYSTKYRDAVWYLQVQSIVIEARDYVIIRYTVKDTSPNPIRNRRRFLGQEQDKKATHDGIVQQGLCLELLRIEVVL